MISETTINERQLAAIAADEYRNQGYEVTPEARLDFMPGFFRADLLARKGDEVRVIEVKARASLKISPQIVRLAEAVKSKPGWHFDLILVGDGEKVELPDDAVAPLDSVGIARRLAAAETALAGDAPESALLIAWSALEGVLRGRLAADATDMTARERTLAPADVFKQAVFHGIITGSDYAYLNDLLKRRNAIVHGFGAKISPEATASLIAAVRRIAASAVNPD